MIKIIWLKEQSGSQTKNRNKSYKTNNYQKKNKEKPTK